MNKEELDLMYKEGLISDEAYNEILKDIEIVEGLNNEATELKKEISKIKESMSIHDINQLIFNNTPNDFNYTYSL